MNKDLKHALVAVVCMATIATASAQSKSAKRPVHSQSEVHHKATNVTVPDQSKKLNSDLTKLEAQTSKSLKPARPQTEKRAVAASKAAAPQGRRSNPPINFTYSGRKTASSTHGGGASRGAGGPKIGARIK